MSVRFKYLKIVVFTILLAVISFKYSFAQEENSQRPKVGLVLSGGGAKGMAHVGVLKVLEEVGMPIDYIGGTSMGSIVGGLYAAGYSANQIDSIIHTINWEYLLSDAISRRELSITEKHEKDRFKLSFPFSRKGIKLPEGIIRGQHVESEFEKLTSPVYNIRDFNQLPIPFLCVAVDIESGDKVVFKEGSLSDAMRASMSIPSVFVPMEIDGHKYVDGGITDNFPVAEVIKMGADIIIGVDVGHGSQGKKESNLITLLADVIFMSSTKVMEENKKSVDIYISPDLKGLGTSSFTGGDSLILYGEEAGREVYSELKSLADSLNGLTEVKFIRKPQPSVDSILIKSIQIEGLLNRSEKFATADVPFSVLEWVTPKEIQDAVEDIYASGYYDKVTSELIEEVDGTRLILHFREKIGGLLRFGFYYDNDYKAALFLNGTFYNLLINDSKLAVTLGLGRSPSLNVQYFMDKGPIPAPGVEFSSSWETVHIYADSSRSKIASVNYSISDAKLFIQSNFTNFFAFRLGGEWTHGVVRPDVSLIEFGNISDNFWGLFGTLYADTYDHPYFPKKGQQAIASVKFASNVELSPIYNFRFRYRFAQRLSDKFTLIPSFYGGISIGDSIPLQYSFPLGGLTEMNRFGHMPFIGYKYFETGNDNVLFARFDLQFQFYKNMYLILMGNVGYQSDDVNKIFKPEGLISGYGLTYGIDTPVGPLKISIMRSGEKQGFMGHVQLGYWF